MAQIARRAGFGIEPFEMVGVGRKAGGECFKCNDAIDKRITSLVDHTHGTLAKLGNNLEFAELLHGSLGANTVSHFRPEQGWGPVATSSAIVPEKARRVNQFRGFV